MKRASRVEAEAADWIARRDSDAWSDEQQLKLHAWLDEATAHRIAFLRLELVWRRADRLGSIKIPGTFSVVAEKSLWERFPVWRMAAGLVVAAAVGMIASAEFLTNRNDFSTSLGESKAVALADGTRVVLNTNTHIRADMADGRRTIWLEDGEAYFEVAHDARHPFVVDAGGSQVTVLGTKFSVRRDGDHISVAVVEGRVQVSAIAARQPEGKVVIGKNQFVVVEHGGILQLRKTAEEIENQLGWRDGRLILDQMTLEQAAVEFNRYNKKKLVIADPTIATMRIGGSFNVGNVDGFARLLNQGFGLKIKNNTETIEISG